jgi:hypothetical protein
MQTKKTLYGMNGKSFTWYSVWQTPLERIYSCGKRYEEKPKKLSYTKELEVRKRAEEVMKKLEEDFGDKSKSSDK